MKKIFALVLVLSLIVFGSSMAFAAEVSLAEENLGRGAGDSTVVVNADGSVTTKTSNISFYLADPVQAGETVTVHIKGSSDGDFRVWLIDVQEVTNSDIYQISTEGFTSGEFDKTFNLTATAEATEIFFKAPSWDATLNNLTITELSITPAGEAANEADAADEADEVVSTADTAEKAEDKASTTSSPKTGVVSTALFLGLGSVVFGAGTVVLKKKED